MTFGDDLYRCVKCGSCRSVCPVFAELERESSVARGKLALIEEIAEGKLEVEKRSEDIISLCLGCSACVENCSNGVRAVEIIMAAREALVNAKGMSLPQRTVLSRFLNTTRLMPALLKTGSLLQGLFLKRIPGESGLHLRFPLPYLDKKRFIPPLAEKFFLEQYGGKEIKTDRERERVGYFVGCVTNYLFPSIGEATLNLLKERSTSIIALDEQGCCGLPAYGAGDMQTFRELALRNIKSIEKSGLNEIIVSCSSCAFAFKKLYPKIFRDDERVNKISSKIVEISQYLNAPPAATSYVQPATSDQLPATKKVKVTYHDPCHLNRELGIKNEPREILKTIPGIEFVEMSNPSRCCGSGGSFNLSHYDLSLKILDKKMESIRDTGAEIVVTNCSGCMLQLKDGAHQKGMKVEVLHLAEAIKAFS
ncbi:MAG: (Fe-S)-binding protein [Proteobacteria bacterium]|nr:(Fe-S)-binding protein [Pseudomonadota bacterium]